MNNTSRFYDIAGVGKLPSVTTILSVISKPGLYLWQAKQGTLKALNIMERLKEMSPYLHDSLRKEFGEAFFRDGNTQAAEAADYGTKAHSIIERLLKGEMSDDDQKLQTLEDPVKNAVMAFLQWRDRNQFKLIRAESVVYSNKFEFAGTADAIGAMKDGVALLDWKTSKRIYPEYSLQAVAYKYAAEEMSGEKIPRVVICRFGKDGAFEDHEVPMKTHPELFDRFIDAKRLWKWQYESAAIMA